MSLGAMDAGRGWFLLLWRNPVGTTILYTAFVAHLVLALTAVHERRTLRIPFWELLRLALGLSIPLLVASHVMGTRVAHAWFGAQDTYERMMWTYWQARPDIGLKQASPSSPCSASPTEAAPPPGSAPTPRGSRASGRSGA